MQENKKRYKIFNIKAIKQLASCFIVFAIFAQIIIGEIILQTKQANAFADTIGGPSQTVQTFWDIGVKTPTDLSVDAYMAAIGATQTAAGVTSAAADTTTAVVSVWEKAEKYVEGFLEILWTVAKKKMLDMLVNNIITWIQGGGDPKFVTNWKEFLKDAANEAGGQFIDSDPNLSWLCDSFGTEIKIGLGAVPTFKEEIGCTLDDVAENIDDFYNDMRDGGGWDGWLKVSQSNNNVFGAYWTVMGEKMAREASAKEAALNEAVSSTGFLGDKVCEDWDNCDETKEPIWKCVERIEEKKEREVTAGEYDACAKAASCECKKWRTRTPGKILADTTTKALGLDIDWLVSADKWNEYLGAILDAAINRLAGEAEGGLAKMSGSNDAKNKQYENDLYSKLYQTQSSIDQRAGDLLSGANGKNAIDIATRKGQRQLLLNYRKLLRDLKSNIKQAVIYLEEQSKNSKMMANCAEFKLDMCAMHANNLIDYYLMKDAGAGSLNKFCNDKKTSCIQSCQAQTDDQSICQQNCENQSSDWARCTVNSKEIISTILTDKCSGIQDQKDSAQEFLEDLNTKDLMREYERIYAGLSTEEIVAKNLLQKLENYKPFDECLSEKCDSSSDYESCEDQVLFSGSKQNFIEEKCNEVSKEKLENCIKNACSLKDDSQTCKNEDSEDTKEDTINKCVDLTKEEYAICKNNLSLDTSIDSKFNISSGACFSQKIQLILGTYEEFDVKVQTICGDNPEKECYENITYDPYNKCIRDNRSSCGAISEAQCYNLLTATDGICYEKQFKTITYDDLIDNPETTIIENSDTTITDAEKTMIEQIQETKQQQYSIVLADTETNLKSMQRSGEECFDKSAVPDGKYNNYEISNMCIKNVMITCAPTALTGDAYEFMTDKNYDWHGNGYKTKFYFSDSFAEIIKSKNTGFFSSTIYHDDFAQWESFWRGCYRCTAMGNCFGDLAGCQMWWQSKDAILPYQMLAQDAAKIDIWNINLSSKYWPNTRWTELFNLDSEIENIKLEIEDSL